MKRMLLVLCFGVMIALLAAPYSNAGMFVATAKNLRGAMYLGYGPTPGHASEVALVKCSQDSFIPPTCRVVCVRMDAPPMAFLPKVRKPIMKSRRITKSSYPRSYPRPYSWGQTRP